MSNGATETGAALEEVRSRVVDRMRVRRGEIDDAIHLGILDAVPDPVGDGNVDYREGLRETITAVLDYALDGLQRGSEGLGPVPIAAVAQARLAARAGIRLDIVLRRYIAGYRLLGEFIAVEIERAGLSTSSQVPRYLRHSQEALLEELTAQISAAYNDEREQVLRSSESRRAQTVHRALTGGELGPEDLGELAYQFDSCHLGVVAVGAAAGSVVDEIARRLGRRLLQVAPGDDIVWAWIGGERELAGREIEGALTAVCPVDLSLAVGEQRWAIDGWRETHDQALAALAIALRRPGTPIRYASSPLLAAALRDETLANWLRGFLAPLDDPPHRRIGLRRVLRAYIDAECNRSSAASALGTGRHTVGSRLRAAEVLLGRPVHTCLAEIDVALRLEDLVGDHVPTAFDRLDGA
jgi:PucR-like helix-turn-helix protein